MSNNIRVFTTCMLATSCTVLRSMSLNWDPSMIFWKEHAWLWIKLNCRSHRYLIFVVWLQQRPTALGYLKKMNDEKLYIKTIKKQSWSVANILVIMIRSYKPIALQTFWWTSCILGCLLLLVVVLACPSSGLISSDITNEGGSAILGSEFNDKYQCSLRTMLCEHVYTHIR